MPSGLEEGRWSERSYGRFSRSITLPEGIDAEHADAKFENGVLDIAFNAPRKETPKATRIDIR